LQEAIKALKTYSELRPANPFGYVEMGFVLGCFCPLTGKCMVLNTSQAWERGGITIQQFIYVVENMRQQKDFNGALARYGQVRSMGAALHSPMTHTRYR